MTKPHEFAVHQEEDVVASHRLVRIAIVSVVLGVVGVIFGGVLLVLRLGSIQPSVAGPHGTQPAPSEISDIDQTPIWGMHPGEDLQAAQERDLSTWGWVDRDAGIVRIPIERAMDIVAKGSR